MRRWFGCFLLLLALAAHPARALDLSRTLSQAEIDLVMEKVYPALVRIFVVEETPVHGRLAKKELAGSGVILSPDGMVVTNHHVVGHARRIWCTMRDRQNVDAKLVGSDALTDIAVIKLVAAPGSKYAKGFPCAEWGDSTKLSVGERVFAMGSPGAISQTVTAGIVGNTEMVFPWSHEGLVLDGETVGSLVKWIVHDARTSHGSSGGPLVNLRGEVIGINELALFDLAASIPSATARPVVTELIKSGAVRRAWTGIEVQPLLESQRTLNGVLVRGVAAGSPGEKAGVKSGDLLVSFDGHPVVVRHREEMSEFNRMVFDSTIGKSVTIRVSRGGKERDLTLTPVERGPASGKDLELQAWGMTARDLTTLASLERERPTTEGVLVTSITPAGPCAEAKPLINSGDIILEVDGKAVRTVSDLEERTRAILAGGKETVSVLVRFDRRDLHHLTVVKVGAAPYDQHTPEVHKAWFPAAIQVFSSTMAEALHLDGTKGVRIIKLYAALQKGPFRIGDILTTIDTIPIDVSEPAEGPVFEQMIRRLKIGSTAKFTVLRDGQKLTIPYTLPPRPAGSPEVARFEDRRFECSARDLTEFDRILLRLSEDQKGVIFDSVSEGGWAALAGLHAGDLLLAVNDTSVNTVEDYQKTMEELSRQKAEYIRFQVRRGIHHLFAEVRPDW